MIVSIWQLAAGQHKKKYDLVFHRTRNWCPTVISRTVFYTATMETVDRGPWKLEVRTGMQYFINSSIFWKQKYPYQNGYTHKCRLSCSFRTIYLQICVIVSGTVDKTIDRQLQICTVVRYMF